MKPNQIFEILKVVAWILFIGLCIEAGALLFNFIFNIITHGKGAENFYSGRNYSDLYRYNIWHFIHFTALVVILAVLKAKLFYRVIQIITKLNLNHPFSKEIGKYIFKISNDSLQIAITAIITNAYGKWLAKKDIWVSSHTEGTEFLILAGVVFLLAQIFKKGIELQSESELTI